jgi:hypothetical protein
MRRIALTAALLMLVHSADAGTGFAPPEKVDVKVVWEKGYPKHGKDGELLIKGKVVLGEGWSSADGKVLIWVFPTEGGLIRERTIELGKGEAWEAKIDVSMLPSQRQNYQIRAAVEVWKGRGTKPTTIVAPQTTLDLPRAPNRDD